ncbi:hypothetical protein AAFF_G00258960 [Aldrovandia affinis]|uniref:Uncharacterized protein n=1 Tax=Aldrovandia affinis TaxID=143900 RepID=A0AAD7STC4_9TELE|nr:hypothetical protein AAFF_G00258960 [Aldrovandia affinis]
MKYLATQLSRHGGWLKHRSLQCSDQGMREQPRGIGTLEPCENGCRCHRRHIGSEWEAGQKGQWEKAVPLELCKPGKAYRARKSHEGQSHRLRGSKVEPNRTPGERDKGCYNHLKWGPGRGTAAAAGMD